MKLNSVISVSIFMNSRKIQNLFGPHPSHLRVLLSLPPSSRFRIWISGSQTHQCPLTPRLSLPLFFSLPLFLFPLSLQFIHASFMTPYTTSYVGFCPMFSIYCLLIYKLFFYTSSTPFWHNFLSFTGHITLSSLILQPPYVF